MDSQKKDPYFHFSSPFEGCWQEAAFPALTCPTPPDWWFFPAPSWLAFAVTLGMTFPLTLSLLLGSTVVFRRHVTACHTGAAQRHIRLSGIFLLSGSTISLNDVCLCVLLLVIIVYDVVIFVNVVTVFYIIISTVSFYGTKNLKTTDDVIAISYRYSVWSIRSLVRGISKVSNSLTKPNFCWRLYGRDSS